MAQGYLQVDVVSDANSFPVQDADIVIARTEEPDEIIEETRTNSSGQTENLPLDAPPLELSLLPEETERPYAEYTIRITAPGFEPFVVSGTEVLADVTAIQGIRLRPLSNAPAGEQTETVTIPDHTLYGERSFYPEWSSPRRSWYMTEFQRTRPQPTIMSHIGIISKT